ncbi:MAG TPA: glycine cleavage system protein GcvH [Chthoniobacteraceae bacterium]|nr:glycine cleavage system protein GcvH [Chthoniobacteraceae bacterium]
MSNIPQDLKYAETHEWLRVEGDTGTVGISDHAQAELTDIVYVELPAVGAETEAGKGVAVVESVKAASDIYSPVGGTITAVNEALVSNPGLVNTDPYGEGWLFKLKITDAAGVAKLKTPADYTAQVGG